MCGDIHLANTAYHKAQYYSVEVRKSFGKLTYKNNVVGKYLVNLSQIYIRKVATYVDLQRYNIWFINFIYVRT